MHRWLRYWHDGLGADAQMTSTVLMQQSQLERASLELAEQERMFTLMGRAIRMAGYRDPLTQPVKKSPATIL
ncbi:MAG: hypothetical protein EBQ83_00910, partial [Burkholderiaceae bacterium]|nr:hypothetical protein [Burkholderiaceae bacterium]